MSNGEQILRPLSSLNALSARTRKFSEKAGSITWNNIISSDQIKSSMARLTGLLGDDRHPDSIKSVAYRSGQALADLCLDSLGIGAKKAKSTATLASKKLYVDKVKRGAGVPTNTLTEATNDIDIRPTNLGPLANSFFSGESVDSRYDVPTTAEERLALSNALQSAADHFKRLTGFESTLPLKRTESDSVAWADTRTFDEHVPPARLCYYTQWTRMQEELRTHWHGPGPAPQLIRLRKWVGGIRNWNAGQQGTSLE